MTSPDVAGKQPSSIVRSPLPLKPRFAKVPLPENVGSKPTRNAAASAAPADNNKPNDPATRIAPNQTDFLFVIALSSAASATGKPRTRALPASEQVSDSVAITAPRRFIRIKPLNKH